MRRREEKDRDEEEESTAQASLEQPDHVDDESEQQASTIKVNDCNSKKTASILDRERSEEEKVCISWSSPARGLIHFADAHGHCIASHSHRCIFSSHVFGWPARRRSRPSQSFVRYSVHISTHIRISMDREKKAYAERYHRYNHFVLYPLFSPSPLLLSLTLSLFSFLRIKNKRTCTSSSSSSWSSLENGEMGRKRMSAHAFVYINFWSLIGLIFI